MLLFPFVAFSREAPQPFTKHHRQFYRDFLRLYNNGPEDQFCHHADSFLTFLRDSNYTTEYFKIKTNLGFFLVNHEHPLRAMNLVIEMNREQLALADTTLAYLVTGLRADIYKITHNTLRADSCYRAALRQVGQRDPKFTLLTHMSLTEVNLALDPQAALRWADTAIAESEQLNNIEFHSAALAIKSYLYFMLGMRQEFFEQYQRYTDLKADYLRRKAAGDSFGYRNFNERYENVLRVAQLAFDGQFAQAIRIASTAQVNVDRQMLRFRINGLEGEYQKEQAHRHLVWGFIAITALYVFVYIMGRRRLWLKIKKRERELEVALQQADAANRMKAAFIRSMSHEIRTPLNAITGFSQILCSPSYELSQAEKDDMKHRITTSSEAITIIINELLELAAGESVTLDRSSLLPVGINDLCAKAIERARQRNTKQLQLSFTTTLPPDFSIPSNSETLTQILDKVIDNALKFTDQGSVTLHAQSTATHVLLSVTDTGVGIPLDRQADIFDNFVKLDDYKEGVGLGLTICRRLVKMLGGNITVDSTYTTGSRFVIQLPVK